MLILQLKLKEMKKLVKKIFKWIIALKYSSRKHKYYHYILKKNGIKNVKSIGEDKWVNKWSILDKKIDPIYYRIFSSYIGENPNIVPDNICHNIIEPILNPRRFRKFHADKNIFDKLFPKGILPQTILRKMDGIFFNANYEYIDLNDNKLSTLLNSIGLNKIIIKPSLDTSSGVGVKVFIKEQNNSWHDILDSNTILNCYYLKEKFRDNLIIQEYLEQYSEISKYNESSINTIRLTLYKSVKNNESHITSAIMRIGNKGSVVDNAHAGGRYVGIHLDGTLGKVTLDQWGGKQSKFNDINFENEHKIPNWNRIIEFSKSLGQYIPQCKLIALDIMVAKDGEPRLIEYNVSAYSSWLFQFSIGAALGEYTDEIIEYCKDRISSIEYLLTIK